MIFSGYIDHRPTREHSQYHELWYESTITTTKLQRNMHKMMELIDIPYVLKFSAIPTRSAASTSARSGPIRVETRSTSGDRRTVRLIARAATS